jgi:hypothetical protein
MESEDPACNLHVRFAVQVACFIASELLIHRWRSGLTHPLVFIHVRFWDLIEFLFQSIAGGETLLASE